MVDSVNNIYQYNYNTVANIQPHKVNNAAKVSASHISNPITSLPFNSNNRVLNKRTELSSANEKQKYTELLQIVDKNTKINDVKNVMCNAFGFGGTNAVIILGK